MKGTDALTMSSPGQPLYVDGRAAPIRVELLKSALLIRTAAAADALCPVRRLDRVHCWGEVWWTAEALAACGQAGVPVAFHKGGEIGAFVAPRRPRLRTFGAALERAAENPAFERRFEDWTRHEASRAAAEARRRLAGELPLRRAAPGPKALERQLQPLLALWLRRRLAERSVPVRHLGPASAGPDLAAAFAAGLGPGLVPLARRIAAELAAAPAAERKPDHVNRRLVAGFEGEVGRLSARFASAWLRFSRLVRDLADGDDLWDG